MQARLLLLQSTPETRMEGGPQIQMLRVQDTILRQRGQTHGRHKRHTARRDDHERKTSCYRTKNVLAGTLSVMWNEA